MLHADTAFTEAKPFHLIHGIYTKPNIGSQVKPKLFSKPILAALRIY